MALLNPQSIYQSNLNSLNNYFIAKIKFRVLLLVINEIILMNLIY